MSLSRKALEAYVGSTEAMESDPITREMCAWLLDVSRSVLVLREEVDGLQQAAREPASTPQVSAADLRYLLDTFRTILSPETATLDIAQEIAMVGYRELATALGEPLDPELLPAPPERCKAAGCSNPCPAGTSVCREHRCPRCVHEHHGDGPCYGHAHHGEGISCGCRGTAEPPIEPLAAVPDKTYARSMGRAIVMDAHLAADDYLDFVRRVRASIKPKKGEGGVVVCHKCACPLGEGEHTFCPECYEEGKTLAELEREEG